MRSLRRIAAAVAAIATLGGAVATAAKPEQFSYFRMSGVFSNMPGGPGSGGTFAIAIDAPATVFAGNSYTFTTRVVNAQGPVDFTIQSGQLPAGIVLDSATGGLSGTISALGFTSAIIEGTDSATGATASASLAVNSVETFVVTAINAPTSGAVASPYAATFQVHGGTQPYAISSSLPPGLALSPSATSATISGIPTVRGSFPITVNATDATGLATAYSYDLAVGPSNDPMLSIELAAPFRSMVGQPYAATASISGGYAIGGYTLNVTGNLPPGLTVDLSSGNVAGTPTVAGDYGPVVVSVSDSHENSASSTPFSISVSPALTLSADVLPGTTGYAYKGAQFTAAGGAAPYSYSVSSGTLPAGLIIDASSGNASGTPSEVCTCAFTVRVTDANGFTAESSSVLNVVDPAPVTISGAPPATAIYGQPYWAQFIAGGGDGQYVFALSAGILPAGLSISPSGTVAGTPTAAGTFAGIEVQVHDGHGAVAVSQPLGITVSIPPLTITTPTIPNGNIGTPVNVALNAAGGSGQAYQFTWSGADNLPPGLTLNATSGVLSGIPYDYYDQTITFAVTDSFGATTSTSPVRIHIFGPLSITGIPDANATVGTFYQATLPRAYGGTETGYSFDVVSGALPPGLTLGSSGYVSGIPTAAGSFDNLRIRVTDSQGTTAISPAFSIVVADSGTQVDPVSAAFTSVALPVRVGVSQRFAITLEGYGGYNTGPYEFHPDATLPLPPGVTVDQLSGTISGSVSTPGVYPLRVVVVDVSHPDAPSGYSDQGNVVVSSFTVDTSPDPGFGRVGQPMNLSVVASGGSGPFTYAVGSGVLPPGLSLNPTSGTVTGSPTTPGGWMLTFVAKNSEGLSIESLQIPINISAATDGACYAAGAIGPGAEVGYWVMATAFSPNSGTVTGYAISGAPLPDGVSWETSVGLPIGAPTVAGSSGPMLVTPQDSNGGQCASSPALGPYFIETVAGLTFDTTDLPPATTGSVYSTSLQASAGKPGPSGSGYWFTLQMDQKMPPGLSLNQSTGSITGVPTAAGAFVLDLTVTDAWGYQAFSELTLQIN
jgi:large repetitive protein